MDRIKKNIKYRKGELKASTLIETLVASIIFLAVFTISLDTAVRITSVESIDAHTYLLITQDLEKLRKYYTEENFAIGEYSKDYQWGEAVIAIEGYRGYENLRILRIIATIVGSSRSPDLVWLYEKVE
ncbi:MAG: hypothetical protein LIO77_07870 [Rikenellaceae bacterium]|nr:hypothetical protein [Rikenellaceae bacterium]